MSEKLWELRAEVERQRLLEGRELLSVAECAASQLAAVVEHLLAHEGDPAAQVEAIARELRDYLPEDWGMGRLSVDEAVEGARRLQRCGVDADVVVMLEREVTRRRTLRYRVGAFFRKVLSLG